MESRRRRVLAIGAAVVAALGLLLVGILHTAPVRSRVLSWAIGQLESRAGLRLTADGLGYNLLTGGATLTNVRLAAREAPDQPFFTASRVSADVPLAAYAGRLLLDAVTIEGGRVIITVAGDGTSNLPGAGPDTTGPKTRRLVIGSLHLSDLDVLYDNRQTPLRVEATGIQASLEDRRLPDIEGASGPLSVRGGVDLRWRDRQLRVEPFEARLAFDGGNVSIQDLPILTELGRVNVAGRLIGVLGAPAFELGFDGQVDTARAATWAPPPVPVSGTTRVKGTISGPADALEIVTRFDAAALTVGTEAELSASGEILIDPARLSANRLIASPRSGGTINAALAVPFGDGPVSVTATWQEVDARALMRAANVAVQPIGTRLDGQAQFVGGPVRSLTLATDLAPLADATVTPLAGRVRIDLDKATWTVTHDLRSDGVTVRGRLDGHLHATEVGRSSVAGPSAITIASLAALDRALAPFGTRVPESVRASEGGITADATISGMLVDPAFTALVRAPSFDVPGLGVSNVAATLDGDRHRVRIDPLTTSASGAEAHGAIAVDLDARTLDGTLHAAVADASRLQADVPDAWRVAGRLEADAALGGTFDAPLVDVRVTAPAVVFAGDTFEALDGRLRVTNAGVEVTALDVRQEGSGRLHGSGRIGFDRTYATVIEATDMSWKGALAGSESRVTVTGRFEGSGSIDRPMGAGRFGLAIAGGVAGDLIGEGTLTVDLFGDVARLSARVPSLGAFAQATVATASPFDYRGSAVFDGLDLATVASLLGAVPGQVTGSLTATAAITGAGGSEAPPEVRANVQQFDARLAGVPLTLLAPAAVSWQSGEVILRQATASLGGQGALTAGGTWSAREGATFSGSFRGDMSEVQAASRAFGVTTDVTTTGWLEATVYGTHRREDLVASFDITGARVETPDGASVSEFNTSFGLNGEALTLHTFRGRAAAAKASGTFSGKGRATIPEFDPMRLAGRVELDSATFDSAGLEVKQSRPTTISIERGVVTMEDVVWEAAGSQLALGGSVDVSSGSPALNLSVQGLAILRVLSAFTGGVGVDGTANVDARISGTPAAPDLSGTITLVDAELALTSPRIVISELRGPITLDGKRVRLGGVTGSANGGSLTIDGGVVLEGRAVAGGELHVQVMGMAVEYPRGLRSEIDALLTYDVDEASPALRGDVRIQRSAYTEPISLAALARANNAATTRPAVGGSPLDTLRLNVTVTTVEDMRVDNNYGRFEGGAQLRLVGTAARPGMSGQVTLREGGLVYAAGRTFTVSRGTISFTDLSRIQPDLDVQAVTRVANLGDVTMTMQGTPDRFEFDLTSEENASQEEIATALLGGGVTGANALTLLSTDLLGATGRQIGLDALRIDRGDVVRDEFREDPSQLAQDDTDPVTRLTLSKRLHDNVEFTLSQNLAENGRTTILVSYYPIRNLELRAISRDDGTQGVGVRHQLTFGGDPAARATPAAPRTVLTVADVRIEGTLAPFSMDELLKGLKVQRGRAFEFYAWQQDLDGLTARYVDRGHFEARVRGRRDEAGPGAITVVYTIAPGPATRIVVDGMDVPEASLARIRQSWSRGVFDRFIVADAEGEIDRVLLSRGLVDGVVNGTMESSAEFKTLRLTVVPGSASAGRSMRFSGNVGIASNQLQAIVLQWGMAEYGWIDRDLLARTIEEYYRDEGYLGATVTVRPPVREDGASVLPVQIVEGPRAVIREVRWAGLSDAHRDAAMRAADLTAGSPYRLASVDAARQRVDRRYRALGHNNVEVGAATTPVDGGTQVDVTIEVSEGPQQVLQDVETVGATRTREGVVRRALRLPVGQPVDLEEWSLARKRLFDTNVFRSVDIQPVPLGDPESGVQVVRARVTVEEYPPWRFRYGLQADREPGDGGEDDPTDINLGGIAEIRNQNLFGRGITGGAATRLERDFRRVNAFVQTAAFFGLPLRSSVFVYTSREDVKVDELVAYVEDIRGLSFEQRWRRRRGFEITYGYRYENTHLFDPDPNPLDPLPLDQISNVARLTTAFLWDRREEPVSPTRGTFTSVSFERAGSWLGSDSSYGRALWQQFAFRAVGPVVLAGRVMTGVLAGSDIPGDKLFTTGGGTSVRGYGENTLGPPDVFGGVAIGGTSLLLLNQELRFPLYRWIRGVGFFDVGNTFDERYPFDWQELKFGYGVGLRLDSPIGLLRLDYGVPGSTLPTARRRPNELGGGRWYFGLGHIF